MVSRICGDTRAFVRTIYCAGDEGDGMLETPRMPNFLKHFWWKVRLKLHGVPKAEPVGPESEDPPSPDCATCQHPEIFHKLALVAAAKSICIGDDCTCPCEAFKAEA